MGTKTQKLSNVVDQIVQWQSVVVADGSTGLTAVAGRGYFIDTTSGAITVTLPASPKIGDVVQLKDYARTWGTNAVSIASVLTDGNTSANSFSTNGQTVTLVYMDGTKGWSLINEDTTTGLDTTYITATGGTITTSGDFKIHTFTGDGCFVVSQAGAGDGPSVVDYLVVAGGGGGGGSDTVNTAGGGGGAGGFRESKDSTVSSPHTVSPLAATTGLTITTTTYPVTVGAGGTGITGYGSPVPCAAKGSNSVFSTITSTGGGGGKMYNSGLPANASGGSGGGGGSQETSPGDNSVLGQSGNTPPVSPPQGNNGGNGDPGFSPSTAGGGGGGATAVGSNNNPPTGGGAGGAGATTSISGSPTAYAGGGGGGNGTAPGGVGGGGAGANGGPGSTGTAGTANTGGGGGGTATLSSPPAGTGGNGGKGIVIIRYKFQ